MVIIFIIKGGRIYTSSILCPGQVPHPPPPSLPWPWLWVVSKSSMNWRSIYKMTLHIGKDIVLEFCSPSKHGQIHWRREKVGWKVSQRAGSTLTRTQTHIFQQLGVAAFVTAMCIPGFCVSLHVELRCSGSSEWKRDFKMKRKSGRLPLPAPAAVALIWGSTLLQPACSFESTTHLSCLICSDLCFRGTVTPSPLSKCLQGLAG